MSLPTSDVTGEMGGHKGGQKGGHKGGKKGRKGRNKSGYVSEGSLAEAPLTSCTCIFLESNKYFLEDVFQCGPQPLEQLCCLFGLATVAASRLPSAEPELLDVDGALCDAAREEAKNCCREDLQILQRAVIPIPRMKQNQFKLKAFLLVDEKDEEERLIAVLPYLMRLRFLKGPISVFKIDLPRAVAVNGLTAECHEPILKTYATFVRAERARRGLREDVWEVTVPDVPDGSLFIRCAVTCAVHYANHEDLYFLMVWDRKRKEIRFPGGDIIHQTDQDLPAAARREFLEEMQPFGISEADLAADAEIIYYGYPNLKSTARYACSYPIRLCQGHCGVFPEDPRLNLRKKSKEVSESDFLTEKSSADLKHKYHLGECDIPWLKHSKWSWAKSRISQGSPGKLFYAEELQGQRLGGHTRPRISPTNEFLLRNMAKDKDLWDRFTSRFLT